MSIWRRIRVYLRKYFWVEKRRPLLYTTSKLDVLKELNSLPDNVRFSLIFDGELYRLFCEEQS